ncbi:hypothetical protein HDU89_002742 [Geranomyces variabilis]|nr:hypothetical protein HDU89_002742 [Geranomyces variabilis]
MTTLTINFSTSLPPSTAATAQVAGPFANFVSSANTPPTFAFGNTPREFVFATSRLANQAVAAPSSLAVVTSRRYRVASRRTAKNARDADGSTQQIYKPKTIGTPMTPRTQPRFPFELIDQILAVHMGPIDVASSIGDIDLLDKLVTIVTRDAEVLRMYTPRAVDTALNWWSLSGGLALKARSNWTGQELATATATLTYPQMCSGANPSRTPGDAERGSPPPILETDQRDGSPRKQSSASIDRPSQPHGAVLEEMVDAGYRPALPDQYTQQERSNEDQPPLSHGSGWDARRDLVGQARALVENEALRQTDRHGNANREEVRQKDRGHAINSRVHHGLPMAPEHPPSSQDLSEQRLIAPYRDYAPDMHDATSRIRAAADARKHLMNNRLSRSYDRQPIELVRRSSEPGRPSSSRGLVFYHADRALRNTTPPPLVDNYTRPQDVRQARLVGASGGADDERTLHQHETSEINPDSEVPEHK